MTREFVWKKPDGTLADSAGLNQTMAVAGEKVKAGDGPFQLTQDGDPLGKETSRVEVLRRLRRRLDSGDVGPVYRVRNGDGEVVFYVREVKPAIHVIDTNGNDNADKFWSWVVATFPEYKPRFAGAYVCKHISGSSSMSQHSYGNAVDIFFDSLAHQGVVYAAVKRGQAPVPVAHAISDRRIWSPSSGEHTYTGDTHYHLHVDFSPQYSGGCGVRG